MIRYVIFRTDWGYCGLAGKGGMVFRSTLPFAGPGQARKQLLRGCKQAEEDNTLLKELQHRIKDYFEGRRVDFSIDIGISLEGQSDFSQAVLFACRKVGYGQRISYGELARRAGKPSAPRAVGRVISRNPLPLIIPCHRVIQSDGKIGGFTAKGGISLKKRLLSLEQKANQ